jgi:hypothetical protein
VGFTGIFIYAAVEVTRYNLFRGPPNTRFERLNIKKV